MHPVHPPYVSNHFLIFVGPSRPQNAKVGDSIAIHAFEGETDQHHDLEFTVKVRRGYAEATELTGPVTYKGEPHDCTICLHHRSPHIDSIIIKP